MLKKEESENDQRSKNTNIIQQSSDHQQFPQLNKKISEAKQSK
jgi:hypothetical protein